MKSQWKLTPEWNRARYRALALLRDRHREEYDALMAQELKKVGLPKTVKTADQELWEMYGV